MVRPGGGGIALSAETVELGVAQILSPLLALTPHGTTFAGPVTIRAERPVSVEYA
jgi:hypothetical protein